MHVSKFKNYFAVIEGNEKDGFSVFFPDLPGCVSAGDTLEECVSMAEEALNLHVKGMVEDGEELPEPSKLQDIKIDDDIEEFGRILVKAALPGKAKRINISLDENLIAEVDAFAKSRHMTRSSFLASAARDALHG